MIRAYPKIRDLDLRNKRVFIRADFNVPLREKGEGGYEVVDPRRILEVLPTIQYVIEQGGKVILGSHLGRPKGKKDPKFSMEPVGAFLSGKLGKDVIIPEDCIGDAARGLSHQMRPGDVLLLENLRFHKEEEENSPEFAAKLNELCEVFVSDAFGTLHRAHASTVGLPKIVPAKAIGLLVEKELEYLEPLKLNPKRPFILVMGGAKVSDKMGVLCTFLPKVDTVFIGGAMAYAFLKAQGHGIGKSLCDDEQVRLAKKILVDARDRNVEILLPVDHVVTPAFNDTKNVSVTPDVNIPDNLMALDIGPRSTAQFGMKIAHAETIFWNGPVGVFEEPAFANGTFEIARLMAASRAKKLAGGGDVAAAIAKSGCEGKFDFISTGGGATLEYLEGKDLPGLKVLELFDRA